MHAEGSIGIFYETGKEPPLDGPPKLHLLVESNEEYRVSVMSLHASKSNLYLGGASCP